MKKTSLLLLGLGFCTLSPNIASAHNHKRVFVEAPAPVVVVHEPATEIMVQSAPPAEIVEAVGPCPGEGYVWTKGCWKWEGRWVWMKGHWRSRPHPHAVWVPGCWTPRHNHWVWAEGHWR